jgi:hypothetical protein
MCGRTMGILTVTKAPKYDKWLGSVLKGLVEDEESSVAEEDGSATLSERFEHEMATYASEEHNKGRRVSGNS